MTLPTIRELERRLSSEAASSKGTTISMKDAVLAIEEQAIERIRVAEERQQKAEYEACELRKEVDRLQLALGQTRKEAQDQVSKAQDEMIRAQKVSMAESNEMRECHKKEMQSARNEMDEVKKELAKEREALARAESQLEGLKDMKSKMDQWIAKFRIPAPIVQNNAAPPRSATATVSKRDNSGRIVSLTITQSS